MAKAEPKSTATRKAPTRTAKASARSATKTQARKQAKVSADQSKPTRRRVVKTQEKAGRAYGGLSAAERRRERAARLLESGFELFGTEGYANVSIERVCSHAGVTARHFYEAYATREDLLIAVLNHVTTQVRGRVLDALAIEVDDARLRPVNGLSAFLEGYLGDPRAARIVCLETVGVSARVERKRRATINEFARVIEMEAQNQARIYRAAQRDFSLTGVALAGATNELIVHSLLSPTPPSLPRIRRELLLLYLGLIAGDEIARRDVAQLGL
ncbi:MAG: TetR/AcrR family transcriptional regulator [Polyangiaceae bacterium]|nr:TetR/AcrR family transcriptional regulator [Myxococcales bacterium]MCB9590998.1 TetR/AcrR family transcriptional regulator [Polyangiaceae bacterium]